MTSAILLFAVASVAASPLPGMVLHIAAPQSRLAVGEPLRLDLRWNASVHTRTTAPLRTGFRLYVTNKAGITRAVDPPGASHEESWVVGATDLPAGFERRFSLTFPYGANRALLLDSPGTYTLRLEHIHTGIQSNQVKVRIEPVPPDQSGAFSELQQVLSGYNGSLDTCTAPAAAALIRAHPQSPYVQWLKVLLYRDAPWYVVNDWDREEIVWPGAMPKDRLRSIMAENARKMLAALESDPDWGVFEDERRALIAEYAARIP